jgi:hypothetical protein
MLAFCHRNLLLGSRHLALARFAGDIGGFIHQRSTQADDDPPLRHRRGIGLMSRQERPLQKAIAIIFAAALGLSSIAAVAMPIGAVSGTDNAAIIKIA